VKLFGHFRHKSKFYVMLAVLVAFEMIGLGYLYRNIWYSSMTLPVSNIQQIANVTGTPSANLSISGKPNESLNQIWPVQLTNDQAASITAVINKKHQLPTDYVPSDLTIINGSRLRSDAAVNLKNLIAGAKSAGISLLLVSGYRSYNDQVAVYNGYVAKDGQAQADTYSARPGFSEHQTGLVADMGSEDGTCTLQECFAQTAAGQWLAANAQNYGFIIRYPANKDSITGYQYEPWHLRYLGVDTAKAVAVSGLTLDEYYGVAAGAYQ
jgi:zinc D-Ala-D-Ala carboxypeptidase